MIQIDSKSHERALLAKLAYLPDDDEIHEWQNLNGLLVNFNQWREEEPEDIDAAGEIELAVEALTAALDRGLLEVRGGTSVRDAEMRITEKGLKVIDRFEEKFTPRNDNDLDELQVTIKSTDWTGLGKAITEQHKATIRSKSNALLQAIIQSDVDIQTRTDACKRVEAAILLLEAPNAPWREIVSLLNHSSVTAFLAALSLLQFIIGLAQ